MLAAMTRRAEYYQHWHTVNNEVNPCGRALIEADQNWG